MIRHTTRTPRTAPGSLLLVMPLAVLLVACADGRSTSEEWSGASDTTASASTDASFSAPATAAPMAPMAPPPPPVPSSAMRRERAAVGNQALSLGDAAGGSVARGSATGSAGGAAGSAFEGSSAATSAAASAQGSPTTPAMIIRSGTAAVRVDSLEPAMAALRAMTARLGGFVGSAAQYAGEHQTRSAMLELKLPAERFEEAIAGLNPLGRVESIQSSAQDVGEEFVDMTARMANAARLEARLVELLARRTGRLEDVLAVERELARVREEIERYEGRLRFLRSRVALSTLTVTISEPMPLLAGRPGPSPIGEAVRDAWRNAVQVVAAMIATFGALVPVAVVVGLIALVGRRVMLRQRARANANANAKPPVSASTAAL